MSTAFSAELCASPLHLMGVLAHFTARGGHDRAIFLLRSAPRAPHQPTPKAAVVPNATLRSEAPLVLVDFYETRARFAT